MRNIFCWELWSKERYYLWEAGLPGPLKVSVVSQELQLPSGRHWNTGLGGGPVLGMWQQQGLEGQEPTLLGAVTWLPGGGRGEDH